MTTSVNDDRQAVWDAACRDVAAGRIALVNLAGERATTILLAIGEVMADGPGTNWTGTDERGTGGDCFFSTTDVMIALIERFKAQRTQLVTGLFEHSGTGLDRVAHAWIEFKPGVVLNVSNPRIRPVYAMLNGEYYRINDCSQILQRIEWTEVAKEWHDFRRQTAGERGAQVREFAKALLAPTMEFAREVGA